MAFKHNKEVRGKHAAHAAQPGAAQQRAGAGYGAGNGAGQGTYGHPGNASGGYAQPSRAVGGNAAGAGQGQIPYSQATGYRVPIVSQSASQRSGSSYGAGQGAGYGAAQGSGYGAGPNGTQQYNRGVMSGNSAYSRAGASATGQGYNRAGASAAGAGYGTNAGYGVAAGQGSPAQSRTNAAAYYSQMRGKHKSKGKRIAAIIGVVLLVIVLAATACGLWFSSQLDNALAGGESSDPTSVLTPAKAGEPFYMLVLGSDSRENSGTSSKADESGDNQRSDVMILLRVDAANNKATMVSIPRDTPYRTSDGRLCKINEAYNIGGAAESIKAVSELTGVGISHYAEVHFSELEGIVDKLGGVEVKVDTQLSYTDALTGEKVTLQPGKQTLNGQQAQLFARARHEYQTDQDKHRQDNVRQLALAIVKKTLSKPLTEMPQALIDVAGMVGTDMRTGDILALALQYAGTKGTDSMTVYSTTGPSKGDYNSEAGGLWLCYENPEGWAKLMKVVDAGEDPSGLDVESTAIIPSN